MPDATRPHAPPELRALAADLVAAHGVHGAAREIGISHHTLARLLADLEVQSGTLALLREAARRSPSAGFPPPATF